jgi:hypothetical protein
MAGASVQTSTTSNGRLTTVTGPGGGGNRYSNVLAPKDVWQQQNVGGNASVGITGGYARSGNGSAFFSGMDGNSKSDLEIYFSQPVALSSVTSLSYDAYRLGTSSAPAQLVNSLRMLIGDANGVYTNTYLIFEPVYNSNPVSNPIAADIWNTFTINADTILFANNGNLNEPAGTGACAGCYASFGAWKEANAGFTVLGLSTGLGSGWNGTYGGAVDNINFNTTSGNRSWNFEVAGAAGAVPEPATWAMMLVGFGMVAGASRYRRRHTATTSA